MNGRRLRMLMAGLGGGASEFAIYTDADNTSTFDPAWVFSAGGGPMTVDWGDGSAPESHATTLSHTYAAASGRHRATFTCPDWTKLTQFDIGTDVCQADFPAAALEKCVNIQRLFLQSNLFTGRLPNFTSFPSLQYFSCLNNSFSGSIPSLSMCPGLVSFNISSNYGISGTLSAINATTSLTLFNTSYNSLSGVLPSLAACTNLVTYAVQANMYSGSLPDFSPNTKITSFRADFNHISGYTAGSFATQKDLATLNLSTNDLPQAAIDAILVDLVTSLGISGRVACTVNLGGGGNACPSAAGLANVATLRTAGWTVTVQLHELLAPLPIELNQMGFEELGGLLYVVGGRENYPENIHSAKTYAYNPNANSWARLADLPLATGLQSHILRAVGGKLYCIGGHNSQLAGAPVYGSVYEYDPATDTWSTKTPKPTACEDFGSAVHDGKIYCFGGLITATSTPIKKLEIYNPATDTWDTSKADMPAAKWSGDFGCEFGGKIYAIGSAATFVGYPTITPVNTTFEYDPATDTWDTFTSDPLPCLYKEVVALGSKMYVSPGAITNNHTYTNTMYSFIPSTNTWAAEVVPPYATAGCGFAVFDGDIYMVGGQGYQYGAGVTTISVPHLYKLNL